MLRELLKGIFKRSDEPIERNGIQVAHDLIAEGQTDEAIKLLRALLDYRPDWSEAWGMLGTANRAAGRVQESLENLRHALQISPNDAVSLYQLAVSEHSAGHDQAALESCKRALEVAPAFAEPRWLQAKILMKGEDYFSLLARIHALLNPRTYVEIGVFKGESLRLAGTGTNAIGIDPEPQLVAPLGPGQRVFRETSDSFFANHDLKNELGGKPVDLAFIDGMHHFEFALRDFINLERHCTRDSTILIHDCYPLDRYSARRDGTPPFWTGDIWRLIDLLKRHRSDLSIHTVAVAPTGLAIVRGLDPHSSSLKEKIDALVEEYLALDYSYLDEDKDQKLNVLQNDWDSVRSVLLTPVTH